jgi:hypothetical protein
MVRMREAEALSRLRAMMTIIDGRPENEVFVCLYDFRRPAYFLNRQGHLVNKHR